MPDDDELMLLIPDYEADDDVPEDDEAEPADANVGHTASLEDVGE